MRRTYLVVSGGDVAASDDDLAPRVGRVGDQVVALLPVDQLDLDALQRRPAAARRQLVAVHDGAAGGGLGQPVALGVNSIELLKIFLKSL